MSRVHLSDSLKAFGLILAVAALILACL